MTPFEIYLVMQLDSIVTLFGWMLAFSVLSIVALFVGWAASAPDAKTDEEAALINSFTAKWMGRCLGVIILSSLLYAFTPSTKTAAAMFIVPHLTSPEAVGTVSTEARELLDLAKQAFSERVIKKEKDQ